MLARSGKHGRCVVLSGVQGTGSASDLTIPIGGCHFSERSSISLRNKRLDTILIISVCSVHV